MLLVRCCQLWLVQPFEQLQPKVKAQRRARLTNTNAGSMQLINIQHIMEGTNLFIIKQVMPECMSAP